MYPAGVLIGVLWLGRWFEVVGRTRTQGSGPDYEAVALVVLEYREDVVLLANDGIWSRRSRVLVFLHQDAVGVGELAREYLVLLESQDVRSRHTGTCLGLLQDVDQEVGVRQPMGLEWSRPAG